jgi:putative ABC transport system permease protein
MQTFLQDLRYAIRVLARNPGFTVVAVLTLALGIGANTGIFSVINAVLLEPLPFKDPGRLVDLRQTESAPGDFPLDGADYLDWSEQNQTFESMSFYSQPFGLNASGAGDAEAVAIVATQANFFETLGVTPLAGRTFAKGEDAGKDRLVILSYGFWQRHFGGQAIALGKAVELNGEPYTVIGVMPRWFNFPAATDVWIPFDMSMPVMHNRGTHFASAIGRVKKGVTTEQARADLMVVSQRINQQHRDADNSIHSLVFPLKERLTGDSRPPLLILFGAVALVLLVACANIANLLLVRAIGRQREIAVRAALGAGRWRLTRQLLTETLLLSLVGASLGILGAWWAVEELVGKTLPIPRANPIHLNLTVLLFAIGVSVLVGILFGLAPAVQAGRLNLSEDLKSSANAVVSPSARRKLLRDVLVVGEIAISLALLVGAGLLLRSFARLRNENIGVQPKNVLTMSIDLPLAKYKTPAAQRQFVDQLLGQAQQVPGVIFTAATTALPLEGGSSGFVKVPENTNPALQNQLVEVHAITPGYFQVFGIPLLEGKNFSEADAQQAADTTARMDAFYKARKANDSNPPPEFHFVAIINQTMAKTFWPNQDPVGKEFTDAYGGLATVIGIVADVKERGIRQRVVPERYFPLATELADRDFRGSIAVKTAIPPRSLLGAIRADVRQMDSALALYRVRTMDEVVADGMQDTTLQAFLLGIFAAIALLLAAVGLYGVMSYLVTQRTHEIGVRIALGAQQSDVFRIVIGQGFALTVTGVVMGLSGALALTRVLGRLLYGVSATDPVTFATAASVLAGVAILACYIPAHRAMRVDPMVALRYE